MKIYVLYGFDEDLDVLPVRTDMFILGVYSSFEKMKEVYDAYIKDRDSDKFEFYYYEIRDLDGAASVLYIWDEKDEVYPVEGEEYPTKADIKRVKQEGKDAFNNNIPLEDCPYEDDLKFIWEKSWFVEATKDNESFRLLDI